MKFGVLVQKEMYDFNLLVSHSWGFHERAKKEIVQLLEMLGDEGPVVKRTIAEGIIGVRTRLDPREVVRGLRKLFDKGSFVPQYTLKWVPVDLWTISDMDFMKEAVRKLRNRIHAGERWRMTVEKRRYNRHHKIEIIRELAELIDEKVDLENPEKILRVDIMGRYAGISVLKPQEVFSVAKLYSSFP
ncbi:MAG: THUMP domain protein [Candidatus Bathyarchaeota archaeon BA2]|nr:MAG: THUMP domain protein [Candidatus Bathyarchaeota archaeon BA2]